MIQGGGAPVGTICFIDIVLSCLSACKTSHVGLFTHCRVIEMHRPMCDMQFPHSAVKQISQEFRCIGRGKEENDKCKLKRRWSNEAIVE
jgi:hypothetical protein